jgi:outer membrane protein assembly factor BamB
MFPQFRKSVLLLFAAAFIAGGIFGNFRVASAAIVFDETTGLYTDDFTDGSGIANFTNTEINTGAVELVNTGTELAPAYGASGTVTLQLLRPVLLAAWGTLSIMATTPAGTSIKVQALDDHGTAYKNIYLSGNETGVSSFPVDTRNIPVRQCADLYSPGDPLPFRYNCTRPGAIYIKFTLTTTDPAATPLIDSMQLTYTPTQGDLSASPPSTTDPWPTFSGNQQGTNHSPYDNQATYPAFRWVGSRYVGSTNYLPVLDLNNKLILSAGYDYLVAINKNNGSELWRLPSLCNFGAAISQNGTYYSTEINDDYIYAIDTASGQVKWSYFFGGGHGNDDTVIGSDGTIFTIRNNSGLIDTVYAFKPDGTVKWTKTITAETGIESSAGQFSVGADGTLYYGTRVFGPGYINLNLGKLYALDPADGAIKWSYNTGDTSYGQSPIVDASGVVYIGNYFNNTQNHEVKLMAINTVGELAGTLKWEKSFGTGDTGITSLALRDDGKLWLSYRLNWDGDGVKIFLINTDDGATLYSDPTGSNIGDIGNGNFLTSDKVNGLYYTTLGYNDPQANSTTIIYYDSNHDLRWQIPYVYDSNSFHTFDSFAQPVISDNGWLYGVFSNSVYDGSYRDIKSDEFAQVFALAPWTLVPSITPGAIYRSGAVTFSVTTSMQQTNPLTDEANKLQVVLDDSTKIPLTYSSTNGDGDTVWTGDYTVPTSAAFGSHNYTVEANAAMVKTDITVAFASPATGSENTGLTAAGTYTIARNGTAPSSSGGSSVAAPSIVISVPRASATFTADDEISLEWIPANGAFTKYKVSYSANNGITWTTISDNNTSTSLSWTAPDLGTTQGLIKVEGYDGSGVLLATGTSGIFTVIGEAVPDEDNGVTPGTFVPPATDPTVSGTYTPNEAKENNPDFNTDMGLIAPDLGTTVYCTAGELIKGSLPSVYYCGADGKRYVFVNDKVYFSWYLDFSTVQIITDEALALIPLGGNITYRPGSRMVKIQSDPKVYVVARGGVLRWVATEAVAIRLFGTAWNTMIDDVPDSFFVNYALGEPITE